MKNKSMLLKLSLCSAWLVLSFACGSQNQTGGNTNGAANTTAAKNANEAKPETNSNASETDMATLIAESQKAINLPPPNPIENPKAESFYSNTIFFEVPAQWKRKDEYNSVNFKSPDGKLTLSASVRETEKSYKNMEEEFKRTYPIYKESDEEKITLMPVGTTPGIVTLKLKDIVNPNSKTNFLSWESYPPPDSAGKTQLLLIMVIFPKDEFEQHKQLISDIFGAVRFKR